MDRVYKSLMDIGFGSYEARAYCALLDQAPANGYQIAQASGVPRAKIYECLDRLVARGAAVRVESSEAGNRLFAPTDFSELLDDIAESTRTACDRARDALRRHSSDHKTVEVFWRVSSEQDLIARGRSLAEGARRTLHVGIWAQEFEPLLPQLTAAADRGLAMALILYDPHPGIAELQSRGAGAVQHSGTKRQAVPVMGRQFVLVADMARCITGSIFGQNQVEGVFSMNRGVVANAMDLVNHEIYVERMMAEVGRPVADTFGAELERLNAFDPPPVAAKATP